VVGAVCGVPRDILPFGYKKGQSQYLHLHPKPTLKQGNREKSFSELIIQIDILIAKL